MKSVSLLWPGLKPGLRLRALELAGLALLQSLIVLTLAVAGKLMILAGEAQNPIYWIAALAGVLILGAALRLRERYASEAFAVRHVHRLRLVMFTTLCQRSVQHASQKMGSKAVHTVRFASDLTAIRQWAAFSMGRLISGVFLTTAIITGLAILNPLLAKLTLAALVVFALAAFALGRKLNGAIAAQRKQRGRLTHRIGQALDKLSLIERSGRTSMESAALADVSDALGAAQTRRGFWSGALRACGDLSARAGLLIVIAVAVVQEPLDPTVLVLGLLFASLLQTPLRDLTRVYEYWQSATVAARKLAPLFEHEMDPAPDTSPMVPSGGIKPGAKVAIVGGTSQDQRDVLHSLLSTHSAEMCSSDPAVPSHAEVGSAFLDDPLVNGTLSKNLRYRARGAKRNQLLMACKATGFIEDVSVLPNGFATRHPQLAEHLDAAALQRLRWTRAMLGNPPLVVLEAPDCYFLDQEKDQDQLRFRAWVKRYAGTVVYSASTDTALDAADVIWRIKNDRIHVSTPGQEAA